LQFQRSATKQHYDIFKHYHTNIRKTVRTPLIYEIDDLLIDIPEWNYAQDYYKNNRKFIEEMMSMVDGITVSTDKLKEVYSVYNKKIEVIPNHLPRFTWGDDIKPKHERYKEGEKIRIGYFGSDNHFCVAPMRAKGIFGGDFGNNLLNFIRKTTDKYTWVFSGAMPYQLEDLKGKVKKHDWKSILEYPRHLKSLNLDITLAPLTNNLFNECKSNIKSLESVATGSAGIFQNLEPYKLNYQKANTDEEFISKIEMLADDINLRKETYDKDYETLKDQLYWEDSKFLNVKRYINTYMGLFGKKLDF
jgi:hypothetical protein